MRKHFGLVPLLLAALLVPAAVPAPAVAASKAPTVTAARFGGRSFSRPRYSTRYRSPSYRRTYRRTSPFHGLGGGILKALGLAYLFHALFGWGGGGGSPFGLLLLVAIVAFLVGRARGPRRPAY
jgi:uncharacterized membrane protein